MKNIPTEFKHVWLIEDELSYQNCVKQILDSKPNIIVANTFEDCETAISYLKGMDPCEEPDVIFLDISLPGMSGIEGINFLKLKLARTNIIMLTVDAKDTSLFNALYAGASGYLLKDFKEEEELIDAVRYGAIISPAMAPKLLKFFHTRKSPSDYGLTERQIEILELITDGKQQNVIGTILGYK